MNKVLYSLNWKGDKRPTIEILLESYDFKKEEIDNDFGVVEIDPQNGIYAILVDAHVAEKLAGYDGPIKGPYANVRIEPMGLEGSQQEE